MGKFDGFLICTDLDGTLYRKDKTISEENREAIEYFKREGGYFTFITGRMPYYSQDAFEAAKPNVPFGCVNGCLYDGAMGEYVVKTELPRDAFELVKCVEERFPNVGIQICGFDKTYFAKDNDATVRFRKITGVPRLLCDYKSFAEPVGKIIFCSIIEEEILAIEKLLYEHELAGNFDFVRSEMSLYEILPKGADKAMALRRLTEHLGIDMKNAIAIGDYNNDVPMLRAAGVGVAVANASAAALAAADFVTVSNEEHAIARLIYDLESGKFNGENDK